MSDSQVSAQESVHPERAPGGMVAAATVVSGLVGLVPIGRLRGWKRATYSLAEAPLVAFVMTHQSKMTPKDRVLVGALTCGVVAVGKNLGLTADRSAERWLVARGVARPRLVIGVVSGLLGGAWMAMSERPQTPAGEVASADDSREVDVE